MSIFSRFFPSSRPDSTRIESLESKVRNLEDIQEKQTRQLKGLELEWEEVYEKMRHLMARITKRQQTAAREADEAASSTAPETPGAPNGGGGRPQVMGSHEVLSGMRRRLFGGG